MWSQKPAGRRSSAARHEVGERGGGGDGKRLGCGRSRQAGRQCRWRGHRTSGQRLDDGFELRRVGSRDDGPGPRVAFGAQRSEEHTSELQSLMRISYAVFCLKKKKKNSK